MRPRATRAIICSLLVISLMSAGVLSCAAWQGRGKAGGKGAKPEPDAEVVRLVREAAHPLKGDARDYDALMGLIGEARFVLLGEATHGTREFYHERARITRRLIEEKGFNVVVLEADWPDAFRVNEYIAGRGKDASAAEALSGFTRFPRWMWRNAEFRDFVESLRALNASRPEDATRVGLYGMDLYSVADSMEAVVKYLEARDPEAARRARKRYGCFGGYRDDPEMYGRRVAERLRSSCAKEVEAQAQEMEGLLAAWRANADRRRDDDLLSAVQNARAAKNGEAYYRLAFEGGFSTWNLRDSHMVETIQQLVRYFDALPGPKAKVVVWAHNTHQGDARMTEMGESGELNVGHLMREFHDGSAVLVGFTTHEGEVMAASRWGDRGKKMRVRPALPESYSALFRAAGVPDFLLLLRGGGAAAEALAAPRIQRAIGVIYLPETERRSHYFEARLSKQFDAVIHLDVTSAVEPL